MSAPGRTLDAVRASGGQELAERLLSLEASRAQRLQTPAAADVPPAPTATDSFDVDVVMAGGGLSLLMAPVLVDAGVSVLVVEKHRAGGVHREWNAAADELQALPDSGLFEASELDELILARYDHGICRWHGGGTYPVRDALDHAVDAARLLSTVRLRAEARGVRFVDGASVVGESFGPTGVRVRMRDATGAPRDLTARLLIDARGASSPYASADMLCPTVGGVVRGIEVGDGPDQINPRVGEILVTTEGVEDGRQHIWEAFPGREGETTLYLFYYARTGDVGPEALTRLYDRFFATLPQTKRGAIELLRPTFGYIPGWSRLSPAPRAPSERVVLVGDAAARHSPLTYCGFGNMLRSFVPAAQAMATALIAEDLGQPFVAPTWSDAPIHAGTGALSMMMATPSTDARRAGELNQLLDAAFATLYEMGDDAYRSLLRDTMPSSDLIEFLRRTSHKRPEVYRQAVAKLGLWKTGRWGVGLVREMLRS